MTKNDSTVSIFSELPTKKPILLKKKAGRTWGTSFEKKSGGGSIEVRTSYI